MAGTPYYIHAGFILISVANLVVIALLLVVFAAAVSLRWPGEDRQTIVEDAEGQHNGVAR
jgi:hypothetical protein